MPDLAISALDPADLPLDSADEFPIVQDGITKKASVSAIAAVGATTRVNIAEFGGAGGVDCSDAFEDAIAAAVTRGALAVTVPLSLTPFIITREINWTGGVDFIGLGRGATFIDCHGATAGFYFSFSASPHGSYTGDFTIFSTTADAEKMCEFRRVNQAFANIDIMGGADVAGSVNWLCMSQNCLYLNVNSLGGRVLQKLDGGCGSNVFLRCEIAGPTESHIQLVNETSLPGQFPYPIFNKWDGCTIEGVNEDVTVMVDVLCGQGNVIMDSTIYAALDVGGSPPTHLDALVRLATPEIVNQFAIHGGILGSNFHADTATLVKIETGAVLYHSGITYTNGAVVGFEGQVVEAGYVYFNEVDTHWSLLDFPSSPRREFNIYDLGKFDDEALLTRALFVGVENQARWYQLASGAMAWGAGALTAEHLLFRFSADLMQFNRGLSAAQGLWAYLGSGPQIYIGDNGSGQAAIMFGNALGEQITRTGAGILATGAGNKFVATGGLGAGNTAAATTLGTVTKKMEVFDATGASLGFVPIYNTIT